MAQVRTCKRGNIQFGQRYHSTQPFGKFSVSAQPTVPPLLKRPSVAAYNDYLHGNIGITSEKITLKDFMTAWFDNVVALNVKPTTMQTYRNVINARILPYLSGVKVQDLTPAILDKWLRDIQKTDLSFNVLTATYGLLHTAFNYAVQPEQLIQSNPALYVKVPKNAPRNVIKRHIVTPEQFAALLEKYPFGMPYYIPLLLLYHTGMRLGEMMGLSWQDIDFAAKKSICDVK